MHSDLAIRLWLTQLWSGWTLSKSLKRKHNSTPPYVFQLRLGRFIVLLLLLSATSLKMTILLCVCYSERREIAVSWTKHEDPRLCFQCLWSVQKNSSLTYFRWDCVALFMAPPPWGLSPLGSSSENILNQLFPSSTIRSSLFSYMMNLLLILILVDVLRFRCSPFRIFYVTLLSGYGGYHGTEEGKRLISV